MSTNKILFYGILICLFSLSIGYYISYEIEALLY